MKFNRTCFSFVIFVFTCVDLCPKWSSFIYLFRYGYASFQNITSLCSGFSFFVFGFLLSSIMNFYFFYGAETTLSLVSSISMSSKKMWLAQKKDWIFIFLARFFNEKFRLKDWHWSVWQAASTIRLKFWVKFCFLTITQMFLNGNNWYLEH